MISRCFKYPKNNSFFLFGPRGTGKSSFLKSTFGDAIYLNLLEDQLFQRLLANPSRLVDYIPADYKGWVVIDEIQKIPPLLDEVHTLIEERKLRFALTGSSARKLRKSGVNLLAGRAFTQHAFPLTALELKEQFDLKKALTTGLLPKSYLEEDSASFLKSYVTTYLKEEVMQEGLVRQLAPFMRFLEAASFSQAQVINYSNVASDCSVERKTVTNYFQLLDDLLLAHFLDVFTLRAKRELIKHRKFYFFDLGVFKQIRPQGPLDSPEEILGAALETLVLQELLARNEYQELDYKIYYWHTKNHCEVDFILYGKKGFHAIEVKSSSRAREQDFAGLHEFHHDYPQAKLFFLYAGNECRQYQGINIIPVDNFLRETEKWIG